MTACCDILDFIFVKYRLLAFLQCHSPSDMLRLFYDLIDNCMPKSPFMYMFHEIDGLMICPEFNDGKLISICWYYLLDATDSPIFSLLVI